MSLLLSLLLIVTVSIIVVFEVLIQKKVFSDQVQLIVLGRYAFVILMILITTSVLFKFGTKHDKTEHLYL
jgi:membrane protein